MRKFIIAIALLLVVSAAAGMMLFSGDADSGENLSMVEEIEEASKQDETKDARRERRRAKAAAKKKAKAAALLLQAEEAAAAQDEASVEKASPKSAKGKTSTHSPTSNRGDTPRPNQNSTGANPSAKRQALTPEEQAKMLKVAQLAAIKQGVESDDPEDDEFSVLTSRKWSKTRLKRRFEARGTEEPKRILTDLTGKIMVHGIRKGLPKARVVLHSFFPETNRPTDQLIPVVTEFTTDDKGFFSGKVPMPERYPEGHAVLTISVIAGAEGGNTGIKFKGKRQPSSNWAFDQKMVPFDGSYGAGQPLIIAKALTQVVAGEKSALGIFWVGDNTANIDIQAIGATENDSIKALQIGHLYPKRWAADTIAETLRFFPTARITPEISNQFTITTDTARLGVHSGPPRVALLVNDELHDVQLPNLKGRSAKDAGEESLLRSPINDVEYQMKLTFALGPGTIVNGLVQDLEGNGLADASIAIFGAKGIYYGRSDVSGGFAILTKSETNYVHVQHPDFVDLGVSNTGFTNGDALTMRARRTEVIFNVIEDETEIPINNARVTFKHATYNDNAGRLHWKKEEHSDLTREGEGMLFEWNGVINKVTISADGFTVREVTIPKEESATAFVVPVIEVRLEGRRKIEVSPQDAVMREVRGDARWFDAGESDDVFTYWSHINIDYEVNFSREDLLTEEEQEAVPFELTLGLRNQGIVDNVYDFQVDVFVDGSRKGRLTIRADTVNERFGTINLGKLKGRRRITLRWLNDKWIPNELDANIRIASLRFLEVK